MTDRKKNGPKPPPRPDNAAIIAALEACSGFLAPAAKRLKVTRHSLGLWVAADPELQAAQGEAKEALADVAESAFVARALDKADPASQSFLPLLLRNLGRNAPPPQAPTAAAPPVITIKISPRTPRQPKGE